MNRVARVAAMLACAAFAQTKPDRTMAVWFADGTGIEIHTETTGSNLPVSAAGTETVPARYDFHRLIYAKDGVILGYDVEARKAGQGRYLLRIKPVDTTKVAVGGRGKWLNIPTITAVREFPPLNLGDAVEMDILYRSDTKERIYDVIKIAGERAPARPSQPGRERFTLAAPRVALNGVTIREQQWFSMKGAALGVEIPGHGRFFFALAPSPNLASRPAGWVDHNILRFHAGSDLVEIIAVRNVLENSEFATIWVHTEPGLGNTVEFICGDDVESLTKVKRKW